MRPTVPRESRAYRDPLGIPTSVLAGGEARGRLGGVGERVEPQRLLADAAEAGGRAGREVDPIEARALRSAARRQERRVRGAAVGGRQDVEARERLDVEAERPDDVERAGVRR